MQKAELVRQLTNLLCEESWQGRWSPLDHTNIRPLAGHTAEVITDAGFVLVDRSLLEEADELILDLLDVITGWVGNPEVRNNPRKYNTAQANDFLVRLRDQIK